MDMRFKSLSVVDFMEESKAWNGPEFLKNVYNHKNDLQNLKIEKDSLLFGCRAEVAHLIRFLDSLILYNNSGELGELSDDDYCNEQEIYERLVGEFKPRIWVMSNLETEAWTPPLEI